MPKIFKDVPWKRNVRRLPEKVRKWLKANPAATVVVGCVKTVLRSELDNGLYARLGVGVGQGSSFIPNRGFQLLRWGVTRPGTVRDGRSSATISPW